MTTLAALYARLASTCALTQSRADEIVSAAKPMACTALRRRADFKTTPAARPSALASPRDVGDFKGGEAPFDPRRESLRREPERAPQLDVVARLVDPAASRGGSLIPAWPWRDAHGTVVIDFVSDWGAMFSAWLSLFEKTNADAEELIRSGQRHWIGIANDVLQLFVPDPPEGTYSMVRHHALMLVAATVWLGPESTRRWQAAHSIAAQRFLSGVGEDLQTAINAAERGLAGLLDDPRAHEEAAAVVAWLDSDAAARTAYQRYLGAASLGIAALLESVPLWTPDILTNLILQEHQDPDFNREEIECFAMLAVRSE